MVGGRKINQRHESGSHNVKEPIKLKRVFYEKTEVTHEVAEAKRSKICYDLITGFVAPELNNNKESLFLDIGCGDGSFVVRFKEHYKVFGVGVSQQTTE